MRTLWEHQKKTTQQKSDDGDEDNNNDDDDEDGKRRQMLNLSIIPRNLVFIFKNQPMTIKYS